MLLNLKQGIILLVGPTGSGKSSTLFTMIDRLNTEQVNIVTLEDPVEYNIEGVNQVQVNEKTGMTFVAGLRSILRQDPDIISVGEIRDRETADIAFRSAVTGHLVLSTLHTNDAVSTLDRLDDIGVEPYMVATALKGVISQRLVRRICPNCKEEYTPTEEELENLGIEMEPGLKFYRGKGCPHCFDTGYHGRIAVFEILTINREIRRLIADRKGRAAIESVLFRPDGDFVPLRDNALRLIKEGSTTSAEVIRVINQDD
jgi:type IV pilus assembly protein PilB